MIIILGFDLCELSGRVGGLFICYEFVVVIKGFCLPVRGCCVSWVILVFCLWVSCFRLVWVNAGGVSW